MPFLQRQTIVQISITFRHDTINEPLKLPGSHARKSFSKLRKNRPTKKNSIYFYSNEKVAHYIEAQTSFHCVRCGEVHQTINLLKKHLSNDHRVQFCDVCLDNRKCITAEQPLYSDHEIQRHLREGQFSKTGELILYHPLCQFCNRRFYDLEAFKIHLRMSSHLKCELCDINCPHLKFVYYRNFQELELHHRKTHFVCDLGDCVSRKLENVFVSEALLEDHKRRFHRKHRSDRPQKAENILLGFNKKEDEEIIEFDGVGKDFGRQFTIFESQQAVEKEVHNNESIDVRQFYPEQIKMTRRARLDEITYKLQDLISYYGGRQRDPDLNQIPIYKPLSMSIIHRNQCQRFIKKCIYGKQAETVIDIFFNKRGDYRSAEEWFQALQKKLRSASGFSFFLVFPQLIRNLRDQNKNKVAMDKFYAQKLKLLPVHKKFIFHQKHLYSELIEYTKQEVQRELLFRLQKKEVDLEEYACFLKDMNMTFYIEKQEHIYWVSKEKVTHLYHMVEHCRTKQLLKMNWLLKVGLSQSNYTTMKQFYYLTPEDKSERPLKNINLQQLSLLKCYLTICLQAILDPMDFEVSKKHPKAHYLTNTIDQLPKYPAVPTRQINELRVLEGRSDHLVQKVVLRPLKGIIIDEGQCPSLLAPVDISNSKKQKIKETTTDFVLPRRTLPSQWNQQESRKKKKIVQNIAAHQDQFPSLGGGNNTSKNNINEKNRNEEEQFPLFNFKDKYVSVKEGQKNESKITNIVGFNNKTVSRSYWDEDRTRKKIENGMNKKNKESPFRQPLYSKSATNTGQEEDEFMKLAIAESLKTAKIEETQRTVKIQERIIPKKDKKIEEEEQTNNKSKRHKRNKNKQLQKHAKVETPSEELPLFQRIQEEEKLVKKQAFRLDMSEQKKPIQKERKSPKRQKILSNVNKPIIVEDDFESLTQNSHKEESIINKIIKESNENGDIKAEVRRPKNKKKRRRGDPSP